MNPTYKSYLTKTEYKSGKKRGQVRRVSTSSDIKDPKKREENARKLREHEIQMDKDNICTSCGEMYESDAILFDNLLNFYVEHHEQQHETPKGTYPTKS